MPVEKQIAILYCGTKGLLEDVPVEKIKAFEKDFLDRMEMQHEEVLKTLKAGELNEDVTKTIESVAAEVASTYKKS
jgi:F-type H+-transporting ATPase subunit alpha